MALGDCRCVIVACPQFQGAVVMVVVLISMCWDSTRVRRMMRI
jgi:hypothetical protein